MKTATALMALAALGCDTTRVSRPGELPASVVLTLSASGCEMTSRNADGSVWEEPAPREARSGQ